MTTSPSQELLAAFREEVHGYLPELRAAADAMSAGDADVEQLRHAHRHLHTIKGAAGMIGLPGLSTVAMWAEAKLDETHRAARDETTPPAPETGAALAALADALERYLQAALDGQPDDPEQLGALVIAARRVCGAPESGDLAATAELLAGLDAPDDRAAATEAPAAAAPVGAAGEDVSLQTAFALEAEDHLSAVAEALVRLDADAADRAALQEIRRRVHTLKGAAGVMGFTLVAELSHRAEDVLDRLVETAGTPTAEQRALLAEVADALAEGVAGADIANVAAALERRLGEVAASVGSALAPDDTSSEMAPGAPQRPAAAAVGDVDAAAETDAATAAGDAADRAAAAGKEASGAAVVRAPLRRLDTLLSLAGELVVGHTAAEGQLDGVERGVRELRTSVSRLRRAAATLEREFEAPSLGGRDPGRGDEGFDPLEMDRYTEFHLVLRSLSETATDIQTVGNELRASVRELQEGLERQARLFRSVRREVLGLRTVPLGDLRPRLERAARVTAREVDRAVEVVISGGQTEIDRTTLEALTDPLLHLVRNAVVHGIEPPDERRAAGKPARGEIWIDARHEGPQVVLEVSDDGRGLDTEALAEIAKQRGQAVDTEPDSALLDLVFESGVSTADALSVLSGRGVGLDAVRATVRQLGGTTSVSSIAGDGATFTLRLPLTLAVDQALMVTVADQTFALPLSTVTRVLRVAGATLDGGNGAAPDERPAVEVGRRSYRQLRLSELLGLAGDVARTRRPVLLLRAGRDEAALVVDRVLGAREIVIRQLGPPLASVPSIGGATVTGEGQVVLVLDPHQLIVDADALRHRAASPSVDAPSAADRPLTVLVVDDSVSVRRVVTTLIEDTGWRALTARDGLDALEVLAEAGRTPDAVLLDIEMPRMDGYELTQALRSRTETADVPIVMLSSRAGEKHRRHALDLGATAYVVKPYRDAELVSLLSELVAETQVTASRRRASAS